MRRNWLVVLSWCVGFVWAVGLILNARRVPDRPPPVPAQRAAVTYVRETPRAPEPPPIIEIAEYNYTGNTRSHKFHKRSCDYADCQNCTARFATREEARNAGYTPCGTCKP